MDSQTFFSVMFIPFFFAFLDPCLAIGFAPAAYGMTGERMRGAIFEISIALTRVSGTGGGGGPTDADGDTYVSIDWA